MQKRLVIRYAGQVQGVGFRYTASSVARSLGLKGWVKNTMEGGVELVAEGEEDTLKRAFEQIRQEMNFISFKQSEYWEPATGEFSGFEIRF